MKPSSRLDAIQALRAVAALLVVLDHSLGYLLSRGGLKGIDHAFGWFLGGVGVHLFFVISGFIMLKTTGRQFGEAGAPLRFLRRRVIRIVPMYWMVTTLAVGIAWVSTRSLDATYVAGSYLFIPLRRQTGEMQPIHGVGWTLNYEMMFYALFAGCLLLRWRAGLSVLLLALCAAGARGLVQPLGIAWGVDPPVHNGFIGDALTFWTDPIVLSFAGGIFVALALKPALPTLRLQLGLLSIIALAVGTVVALLYLQLHDQLPALGIAVASTGLVYLAATATPSIRPDGWRRWVTLLGDASYSLYLTHTFVISIVGRLWTSCCDTPNPVAFVLVNLAAAGGMSILVYRYVEDPITRRLNRKLK